MKIRAIILAIILGFASSAAMAEMADPLDRGILAFLKGDNSTALQIFRPLAKNGNKEAQYHLGYMYQTGTGVVQSSVEAFKWYALAARQGHNSAKVRARVVVRNLK